MKELPELIVIKKMIDKVNEKLFSAQLNYNNKLYDDTVSRLYYSVFHIISILLLTKGLTFSSHSQTIGNFNREFIKSKIFPNDFSKKIESLFKSKQIGDYDADGKIDRETAEERLKHSIEIINKCKEYLSKLYNVNNDF